MIESIQLFHGAGFIKHGIKNWKTGAWVTPAVYHLCFSPNISPIPSISLHPSSTLACANHHSFGFTWFLVQYITHRLESQLAERKSGSLYSFQVLSPAQFSIGW